MAMRAWEGQLIMRARIINKEEKGKSGQEQMSKGVITLSVSSSLLRHTLRQGGDE